MPDLRLTLERREQINRRLARLQHLHDERLPIPYDSARRLMRDVTELLHDLDVLEQQRDEARREVEALRADVERLRTRLAELDIATLLRDIAWHAREGDLGGFERLVCAASHLEALADEIDAALAERGGGGR